MSELLFKGKEFVYNHHLSVPYRPLMPDAEKSIGTASLEGNLIIQGDNLHALKALLPRYAGKVDCVFIDPPYNTGNESWSYNDNVNSPIMQEWLSANPVNKEDMLRHDKWCCMMWPRVKLLHELLADDGTIWMTIDDNEVARARQIFDEIFGEDNFLATVCWQKKYSTANDTADFSDMHDFILVYAKSRPRDQNGKVSAVLERLDRTAEMDKLYKNPDDDLRGDWKIGDYTCNKSADERPRLYYPITHPATGEPVLPSRTRVWAYSRERHARNVAEDRVWWGLEKENSVPAYKRFLSEVKGSVSGTWWDHGYAGHTDEAKKQIKAIFHDRDKTFPTPKPLKLLTRILELATDEGSLVLDSFAGSGTTAHALLDLNSKDGGQRRFILVESEDYADTETAERMRRVIKGYRNSTETHDALFTRRLSISGLRQSQSLLKRAQEVADARSADYDRIATDVSNGELRVIGTKVHDNYAQSANGAFTFCTLGEPLNLDNMLSGKGLPDRETLGAWLFHTATGESMPLAGERSRDGIEEWYLAEGRDYHTWLVYRPSTDFLKSRDSALTLELAKQIAASRSGKAHLVFAPSRFAPNKLLLPLGVEYSPLPFGLFRVEKA